MASKGIEPTKCIDLHGIRDAMNTTDNAVRSAVISGIQSGDIHIVKGVSEELKKIDEKAYKDFQQINPKKYARVLTKHQAHAAMLAEQYGSSIFSSNPPSVCFEIIALCIEAGLTIISAGKALKDYGKIKRKCVVTGISVIGTDNI